MVNEISGCFYSLDSNKPDQLMRCKCFNTSHCCSIFMPRDCSKNVQDGLADDASASSELAPLTRNETVAGRASKNKMSFRWSLAAHQSAVLVFLLFTYHIYTKSTKSIVSSCLSSADSLKLGCSALDPSCNFDTSFHTDIKVLHHSKWAADRKCLTGTMPQLTNPSRNHNGTLVSGVWSTWAATAFVYPSQTKAPPPPAFCPPSMPTATKSHSTKHSTMKTEPKSPFLLL